MKTQLPVATRLKAHYTLQTYQGAKKSKDMCKKIYNFINYPILKFVSFFADNWLILTGFYLEKPSAIKKSHWMSYDRGWRLFNWFTTGRRGGRGEDQTWGGRKIKGGNYIGKVSLAEKSPFFVDMETDSSKKLSVCSFLIEMTISLQFYRHWNGVFS